MENAGETKGDVAAQTGQTPNQGNQEANDIPQVSELDMLKSRARLLGINFSNNIGVDALKQKINDKLEGKTSETGESNDTEVVSNPDGNSQVNALEVGANNGEILERPKTLREWIYEEQMRLVRLRITNLDPKKKDLPGEVLTVANEYLGTVRKFIPYGEVTEDGYHVPFCLYEMMRTRKFLNIRTVRDRRTGTQTVQQTWAPEFSLEVLEPLTKHELGQLAQAQIAAGSLDGQQA